MMRIRKTLLSSGIAVAVLAMSAGEAIGGSCIISGSTERNCAYAAWDEPVTLLDTRSVLVFWQVFAQFDSRPFAWGVSEPMIKFRSTDPGLVIIFR